MNGNKIFAAKYGGLWFSLLSGCAYFIIILNIMVSASPASALLGFFFAPAIICGMALVLFKSAKRLMAEEQDKKVNALFLIHVVLILLSLIFLADLIF